MPSPHVLEVTEATFMREVMERSRTTPVLLDVWAAWCGPCQVLGPVLEKVVAARKGQVVLAKIDADQAPNVTSALGITSLPTVALFLDGQPVDGFVGAQPESAVNALLDRHLLPPGEAPPEEADETGADDAEPAQPGPPPPGAPPSAARGRPAPAGPVERGAPPGAGAAPAPSPVAEADALLRQGEVRRAREAAEKLLTLASPPPGARLLAARAALLAGDEAALAQHVGLLEPDTSEARRGVQLLEAQRLIALGRSAGPAAAARAAASPADLEARYLAGLAHFAAGRRREAFDALLDGVSRDKRWNEQAARKALVAFFAVLGEADPLVDEFRKRLVIIL